MASLNTRADSLRVYFTGAASDGGAQTDPFACLGNYASSTELTSVVASISSAIAGITITYIAGANALGAGTLTALDANTVAWTSPGGSQGPGVSLSNGQSAVLEDGTDAYKYIRVSRTSASPLTGTATVTLSAALNNTVTGADVSIAEQSSGRTEYFALMLKNTNAGSLANLYAYLSTLGTARVSAAAQLGATGAGSIGVSSGDFSDWPASGGCRIETSGGSLREIVYYSSRTNTTLTVPSGGRGLLGSSAGAGAASDNIYPVPLIAIGAETPSPNPGPIQTIANKTSTPSGITWKTGVNAANGISYGTLATGIEAGLWIKNVVIPGQTSKLIDLMYIEFAYEAG